MSSFKFNVAAVEFTPRSLPPSPTAPAAALSWADRVKRDPAAPPPAKATAKAPASGAGGLLQLSQYS